MINIIVEFITIVRENKSEKIFETWKKGERIFGRLWIEWGQYMNGIVSKQKNKMFIDT